MHMRRLLSLRVKCRLAGLAAAGLCTWLVAGSAWAQAVALSESERDWVRQNPVVTYCIDPDWAPFERINEQGEHEGISADLLQRVFKRVGLQPQLVRTANWPESLEAARQGRCQVLSFLNETPERKQWWAFTSPLWTEPNIVVTREDHNFVTDLAALQGQTVALPTGTAVAEHIATRYPGLRVILTATEEQAMAAVASRQADMAIRSLAVAAYTIRREGLFMLKIAGRLPDFDNRLRMGVRLDEPMLRSVLDKGVQSITLQERERIFNQHVVINVPPAMDIRWLGAAGVVTVLLGLVGGLWWRLRQRQAEQRFHLLEQRLHMEQRHREIQSRLVAMLSHELRTPVSIIDGATQSLAILLPDRSSEVEQRFQRIRTAVNRIVELTEQFLWKNRVDQGVLQLDQGPTDPVALCEQSLRLLDEPRLRFSAPAVQRTVWADASMLQVAFENLLRNALRYADPGTPIDVELRYEPDDWVWVVTNTGDCIPPEMEHLIFEPYTRAHGTSGVGGAGIGLYLVQRVAAHHHGTVALTRNSQRTVQFTLRLPYGVEPGSSACQA